jgi:hypothetical protein
LNGLDWDRHSIGTQDPDPQRDFGLDQDPQKRNADPKHCLKRQKLEAGNKKVQFLENID